MRARLALVCLTSLCLSLPALGASSAKVIATIPVGTFPNSIVVNPQTNNIYVANYLGNSVSVIDGATNTVAATLKIDHPLAVLAYVGRNQIFVYTAFQGIAIIDGATNRVNGPHPYQVANAVAELGKGSIAYLADQGAGVVRVQHLTTKQEIAELPVTSPSAVATNATVNLAYTCSFGGSPDIPVIDTNSNTVVNTFGLPFLSTASVSADPTGKLLYAAVYDDSSGESQPAVAALDALSGTILGSVKLAPGVSAGVSAVLALPGGFVAAAGGVFTSPGQNNSVFLINSNALRINQRLTVGKNPASMSYNPHTKTLYVANTADNTVSVVAVQ